MQLLNKNQYTEVSSHNYFPGDCHVANSFISPLLALIIVTISCHSNRLTSKTQLDFKGNFDRTIAIYSSILSLSDYQLSD